VGRIGQWRRNEFESGGRTGPARKWGHAPEIFFGSCLSTFFCSKSTISRFGYRFRDGQYSLVSFLFAVFLLTVPPCPAVPYGIGATGLGENRPTDSL